MTPKVQQIPTVEVLTLHTVQHDRVAYAPFTLLTLNAKDAQHLIDCGAARLATDKEIVPIEARAPAGFVALNQTVGEPSCTFMPIAEYHRMRQKQYAGN